MKTAKVQAVRNPTKSIENKPAKADKKPKIAKINFSLMYSGKSV